MRQDLWLVYRSFHRAAAAFFAIIFRFRSDRDAARASPPLDAPNFDSATAAGFRVSGAVGLSSGLPSIFSPMRSSSQLNRLASQG